jgi:hypothetical protein
MLNLTQKPKTEKRNSQKTPKKKNLKFQAWSLEPNSMLRVEALMI